MFGVWSGAIELGGMLFVVLWGLIAAVVAVRAGIARRAAVDVRAGRVLASVGYRRFLTTARRVNLVIILALLAATVGPLMMLSMDPAAAAFLVPGAPSLAWAAALCIIGGALITTLVLDNLLNAVFVSPLVMSALRGYPASRRELLAAPLKQGLITYLPLLVILEAAGLLPLLGYLALAWVALAAFGGWLLARALFAERLRRWLIRTEPLDRSPWAAVAPRVWAWAQLAGVPLAGVRVQYTSRLGWANVNLSGWRRRTVYLSDGIFTEADWRQQDALFAQALGVARAPRRWALARHSQSVVSLIVIGLLLAVIFGVDALSSGGPGVALLVSAGVFILLGALFAYLVYDLVRRRVSGNASFARRILANDRYAAELTGDPLALLVALNTLTALNAMSPEKRLGGFPTIVERVRALDAIVHEPGPRAPWATRPVPSVVPVSLGPYQVTVPLANAPPPAAVPAVRYASFAPSATAPASTYVAPTTGASS
jgi:hypothetical protein